MYRKRVDRMVVAFGSINILMFKFYLYINRPHNGRLYLVHQVAGLPFELRLIYSQGSNTELQSFYS